MFGEQKEKKINIHFTLQLCYLFSCENNVLLLQLLHSTQHMVVPNVCQRKRNSKILTLFSGNCENKKIVVATYVLC